MIQQQQQKTSQWVLTPVQFNLVLIHFYDDECFGPGHEEGWAMNFVQDRSLKTMGELVPQCLAN